MQTNSSKKHMTECLNKLRVIELNQLCRKFLLPNQGKKGQLIDRIIENVKDEKSEQEVYQFIIDAKPSIAEFVHNIRCVNAVSKQTTYNVRKNTVVQETRNLSPSSAKKKLKIYFEDQDFSNCICGGMKRNVSNKSFNVIKCIKCSKPMHISCLTHYKTEDKDKVPENLKNECALCKIKRMDPFYPVIKVLWTKNLITPTDKFIINAEDLRNWKSDNKEVIIHCINLDSKPTRDKALIHQEWPKTFSVKVNGNFVERIPEPTWEHKRRDNPMKITHVLKSGENIFDVSFTNYDPPKMFVIAIVLCKQESEDSLIKQVILRSDLDITEAKERIINILAKNNDDDEIVCLEVNRKLNLNCPITLDRITIPCRGCFCHHIQCFDLKSYIDVTKRTKAFNNRWKCPICSFIVKPQHLIIDSFIKHVLDKVPKDRKEIEIDMSGSIIANEENFVEEKNMNTMDMIPSMMSHTCKPQNELSNDKINKKNEKKKTDSYPVEEIIIIDSEEETEEEEKKKKTCTDNNNKKKNSSNNNKNANSNTNKKKENPQVEVIYITDSSDNECLDDMKKPHENEKTKGLNTNLNVNQKIQEISLKTEVSVINENRENSEVVWKTIHNMENEHGGSIGENHEIKEHIIKEMERSENNNEVNDPLQNQEQVKGFKGGISNESNDGRASDEEMNIENKNILNEEKNLINIKIDNYVDDSCSVQSKSNVSSVNGTDELLTQLMNFPHNESTNRIQDSAAEPNDFANKENTIHNTTITKSIYENYNNTEVNSTPDLIDLLNPALFDKQESTAHTEGNSYNNEIRLNEKNQRDLRYTDYMIDKRKYIIETKKEIANCNEERNNNTTSTNCEMSNGVHVNEIQSQEERMSIVETHKENFKEKKITCTEINGKRNLHEHNYPKERESEIYPCFNERILMKEHTECTSNKGSMENTIRGNNRNIHILTMDYFPCSDSTRKMLKDNMGYSINKKRNHCEIQLSHKKLDEELYKKIKYPTLQIIKNEPSKVFSNLANSFRVNEDAFVQKDLPPMGENEDHVRTQMNCTNTYISNNLNNNNSNETHGICKVSSRNHVDGKLNCCNQLVGYYGKERPPPYGIVEHLADINKEEKELNIEKCNLVNRQIHQFLKIVEKISAKVKETELGKLLCKKFLTPCEREKRKNIMSHFLDVKKCCEFFLVNIRDDTIKDLPWKKNTYTERQKGEMTLKEESELMRKLSEISEENTKEEEYPTNEETMNVLENGKKVSPLKKTSNYTYVPSSLNRNKLLMDGVKKRNSVNTAFVAKSAQTLSIEKARANYLNNVKMSYGNNIKEMRNCDKGNNNNNNNKEDIWKPIVKETTFFDYTEKNNIEDHQVINPNLKENDFLFSEEFFNDSFFKCNNE